MKQAIALVSLWLLAGSTLALTTGVSGHLRGDVIAVTSDDEVVRWCDFSNQIVVTSQHVLCVYNGLHQPDNNS